MWDCESQSDERAGICHKAGKVDLEERKVDEKYTTRGDNPACDDEEESVTNVDEKGKPSQVGEGSGETDLSILVEDTRRYTEPIALTQSGEGRTEPPNPVEESGILSVTRNFPKDGNGRRKSDLSIQMEEHGRLTEPGHVTRPDLYLSGSDSSQTSNTLLSGTPGTPESGTSESGTPESGSISSEGRQETSRESQP